MSRKITIETSAVRLLPSTNALAIGNPVKVHRGLPPDVGKVIVVLNNTDEIVDSVAVPNTEETPAGCSEESPVQLYDLL